MASIDEQLNLHINVFDNMSQPLAKATTSGKDFGAGVEKNNQLMEQGAVSAYRWVVALQEIGKKQQAAREQLASRPDDPNSFMNIFRRDGPAIAGVMQFGKGVGALVDRLGAKLVKWRFDKQLGLDPAGQAARQKAISVWMLLFREVDVLATGRLPRVAQALIQIRRTVQGIWSMGVSVLRLLERGFFLWTSLGKSAVFAIADKIAQIIMPFFDALTTTVVPALTIIGDAFRQVLAPITKAFADLALEFLPAIQGLLFPLVKVFADFITQVAQAIGGAGDVSQFFSKSATVIHDTVGKVLPVLKDFLHASAGAITTIFPAVLRLLDQMLVALVPILDAIIPPLTTVVEEFFRDLPAILDQVAEVFATEVLPAFVSMVKIALPMLTDIVKLALRYAPDALGFFFKLGEMTFKTLEAVAVLVKHIIFPVVKWLLEKALEFGHILLLALGDLAKWWGYDAKNWRDTVVAWGLKIQEWLTNTVDPFVDRFLDIFKQLADPNTSWSVWFKTFAVDLGGWVIDGLIIGIETAYDVIVDLLARIVRSVFGELATGTVEMAVGGLQRGAGAIGSGLGVSPFLPAIIPGEMKVGKKTNLPTRAEGGLSNMPVIAGEAGPELYIPIPPQQLEAMRQAIMEGSIGGSKAMTTLMTEVRDLLKQLVTMGEDREGAAAYGV